MTCRLGIDDGSGMYSLTLRLRPCCGPVWLDAPALPSVPSGPRPAYTFRFEALARAAAIDSPDAETRTESGVGLGISSRDGGRALRSFQGPGESPDRRGDGKGVTSPRADMTGLGTQETGVEGLPNAFAMALLVLGVLETGFKLEENGS